MPRDYYALQRTLTTNAASLSGPVGGRFFLFFLLNENALIGVLDNLFFLPKGDGLVVKLLLPLLDGLVVYNPRRPRGVATLITSYP